MPVTFDSFPPPTETFRVAIVDEAQSPVETELRRQLPIAELEHAGIEWYAVGGRGGELRGADVPNVDAVLLLGQTSITAATLDTAPRLRWVVRYGAGYDRVDVDACSERGVTVVNAPDAVRRPLAIATLTLLLACTHKLIVKDRLVRESRWAERDRHEGLGIHGRVLGIVGFGGVGAELARIAIPLGLRVVGHNRSGRSVAAEELGVEILPLDELLSQSDFVVLAAPITPETRGMLNRERISLLKRSAIVVNVGRGALVDTQALREALETGAIGGAGLDVFDPEPPVSDDPLLQMQNVTLSPHALCWTQDFRTAVNRSVAGALIDAAAGRRPANVVA